MLFLISNNETDLKFSNALLANVFKESDIFKIKQRSNFDENKKEWTIPVFLLADKKSDISFPTINGKQRVD
jgi:hypothetical protein